MLLTLIFFVIITTAVILPLRVFFTIARVKQVYGSPDGMFLKRFPFTGVEPGIVGFLPTKIPAMAVSDMEL